MQPEPGLHRQGSILERAMCLTDARYAEMRANGREQRLAAIIADIEACAAASPDRPTETVKNQFARLKAAHPGLTNPEHEKARRAALAAYPAWLRAGRRPA